jgi:cyclic pyranopterin phosphate synthase
MGTDEPRLTHVDESGAARMVDVSGKPLSRRIARAKGRIELASATVKLIRENALAKGDVLAMARIAGIMAAKKTSEIVPLCHNIFIEKVEVALEVEENGISIEALAICSEKTGVEMEALTAVSAAALAIWDMCKAVDSNMRIEGIYLVEKTKEELGHTA